MSTLQLRRLDVRRMRGVEDGGFTLDDLCGGINLVHGPNASGKTTSARAIRALLWPRSYPEERAWLSAEYTVDGVRWNASVDGIRAEHQREGVPTEPLALPPESERDRYSLALHELLLSEGGDFAAKIARESAGGFDLESAGTVLDPRSNASRSTSAPKALQEAINSSRKALEEQQRIRESERTLAQLEERRKEAEAALLRTSTLEAALDYARARDELRDARIALEAFPESLSRIQGDERERLNKIVERQRALQQDLEGARGDAAQALEEMQAANLPENGLPASLITALRIDLASLQEAEREISSLEQTRAACERQMKQEQKRVGGAIDEEQLLDLEHPDIGELEDFAERAARVREKHQRLETELQILGEAPVVEDAEMLASGIRLLQCWLREPVPSTVDLRTRHLGLAAAVSLAVVGLLVGLTFHPLGYLAGLTGAVLAALLLGRHTATGDPRLVHQREYARLALRQPRAWMPEEIETVLGEMIVRQAEALEQRERQRRRDQVAAQIRAHEAAVREVEEERASVAERLRVAPHLEEGHLYWLATRICRWQNARSDLLGVEARIEQSKEHVERLRNHLRERLSPYSSEQMSSTGDFVGVVDNLEKRERKRADADRDASAASSLLQRVERELASCTSDRSSIFAAIELSAEDEPLLDGWLALLPEYRSTSQARQQSEILLKQGRQRLEARGADQRLYEEPEDVLQLEMAAAGAQAAELNEIREQMVRIDQRVADAKKAHDVEEALEVEERCRAALRDAHDADVRGVVAQVLLNHVRDATRDQHLPAVFGRARELFTRLTHGRYELRFGEGGEARFRAFDNRDQRGRSLDELSTATRVQLLLAVRIAFVESQEQGTKLPLVFDEVLGNSDDERAAAIIEAAIELARSGRQIFYFTAQQDEVGKWQAMLHRHSDVEFREFDLREIRRIARQVDLPAAAFRATRTPRLPAPEGGDHLDYARRLRVPGIHRSRANVGSLHLWYLLDDPAELYRLLDLGAETWGEMEPLLSSGAGLLVGDDTLERIRLRARAADACFREARIGVGKLVDRDVLDGASGVSSTFLQSVVELAREVGGDARMLLASLVDGGIPRFRSSNTEALEEFLGENGYLDRRETQNPHQIRSRVLISMAAHLRSGDVTTQEIDALLQRLFAGMGMPTDDDIETPSEAGKTNELQASENSQPADAVRSEGSQEDDGQLPVADSRTDADRDAAGLEYRTPVATPEKTMPVDDSGGDRAESDGVDGHPQNDELASEDDPRPIDPYFL
ncbi:AAA family ATPase [soil metagenome]